MSCFDRRTFLKSAAATAGAALLPNAALVARTTTARTNLNDNQSPADYTLNIATKPLELAPNHIISVTTYNGQFPGPLLRLKEGERVTIDVRNETDTPEQLHWHGQFVSADVDGAAEEGTPFIPPHGSRRISFVPKPSGFRFYHTHVRAGTNFALVSTVGWSDPSIIEPKLNPGNYDREVFLTLKEFQPTLSRGGDMPQDFLSPAQTVPTLKEAGESKMKASLAKGMPHGYEVGYDSFTINGQHVGSRRADACETGRARPVSRSEWQRD